MKDPFQGLYTLCDTTFSPQYSHLQLARMLLAGGAPILQLRMKGEDDLSRVRSIATEILQLKTLYSFKFILNDYVDLAAELAVDGVHVGENDLPVPEVRKRVGKKLIGYSSHSLAEAQKAQEEGADYIALGAIFPTKTKGAGHPVQGLDLLREFVRQIDVPKVAIGGIGRENFRSVLETGVDAIAMITALTQAPDVTEATRFFVSEFKKGKR